MDKGGVAAAVVSITNPGLWFGDRAVHDESAPARATITARSYRYPRIFVADSVSQAPSVMSWRIITARAEVLRVDCVIATAIDVPHLRTWSEHGHVRPGIVIEFTCNRDVVAESELSVCQTHCRCCA